MAAPVLVQPIPNQVVNELAAYGPFDLKEYIQATAGSPNITFSAQIKDGSALPKGLICTSDGIITGIPSKATQGNYEIVIHAENADGRLEATMIFAIKPGITTDPNFLEKLKSQIWEAVDKKLPIPEFAELTNLPLNQQDIWYLLERFGMIKIWDAFNLTPPGDPIPIELEGVSPHYQVYDRGSCLVAAPKELFSHERTLEDGLQTARAMAREVYKRDWTVELVGFIKYTRAAWIEIQHQGDTHGKRLEVINYTPSTADVNLYTTQAIQIEMNRN